MISQFVNNETLTLIEGDIYTKTKLKDTWAPRNSNNRQKTHEQIDKSHNRQKQ